jgi:hypothetical protein
MRQLSFDVLKFPAKFLSHHIPLVFHQVSQQGQCKDTADDALLRAKEGTKKKSKMKKRKNPSVDAIAFEMLKEDLFFFFGSMCAEMKSKGPQLVDEVVGDVLNAVENYGCSDLEKFSTDCASSDCASSECKGDYKEVHEDLNGITAQTRNSSIVQDERVDEEQSRNSRPDDDTFDYLDRMLSTGTKKLMKYHSYSAPSSAQMQHIHRSPSGPTGNEEAHSEKRRLRKCMSQGTQTSEGTADLSTIPLTGSLGWMPQRSRSTGGILKPPTMGGASQTTQQTSMADLLDLNKLVHDLGSLGKMTLVKSISSRSWTRPSWMQSSPPAEDVENPLPFKRTAHIVRFQDEIRKPVSTEDHPAVITVKFRPNNFPARPRSYHLTSPAEPGDDIEHPDDESLGHDAVASSNKAALTDDSEKEKKRFWRLNLAHKIVNRRLKFSHDKRQLRQNVTVDDEGNVQVTLSR